MEVLEKEKHIDNKYMDGIYALGRMFGYKDEYIEREIQVVMSMVNSKLFEMKVRELPIASGKANLDQMNTPQEEDIDDELWTRIRATSEAGFNVEELEEYMLQGFRLLAELQAEEQRNFFEGLDLLHKNYYVLPKEPHPLSSTQLKKMIKHERNPLRKKQLQKELNAAYKQEKEGGR